MYCSWQSHDKDKTHNFLHNIHMSASHITQLRAYVCRMYGLVYYCIVCERALAGKAVISTIYLPFIYLFIYILNAEYVEHISYTRISYYVNVQCDL